MKLAFTGPYSDRNLGDYGMLVNNVLDFNPSQLFIFSYDKPFIEDIAQAYFANINFEVVPIVFAEEPPSCFSQIDIRFLENIFDSFNGSDLVVNTLRKADVLVVNGGGYFNNLWSSPHRILKLASIIAPLYYVKKFNLSVEVRFTANGFGPFTGCESLYSDIFKLLPPDVEFYTREIQYSQNYFPVSGFKPYKLSYLPDDLLFLSDLLPSNFESSLDALFSRLNGKKYIVLESYLPVEELQICLPSFKKFVRYCRDVAGLDILLMAFHPGHGGYDQCLYLAKTFDLPIVPLNEHNYIPIELAKYLISNASLVVCNRYHATVFALQSRVPVFSILRAVKNSIDYYLSKSYGIFTQLHGNESLDKHFIYGDDLQRSLDFLSDNLLLVISAQNESYAKSDFSRNITSIGLIRSQFISTFRVHEKLL